MIYRQNAKPPGLWQQMFGALLIPLLLIFLTCGPAKQTLPDSDRKEVEPLAAQFMQLLKDQSISEALAMSSTEVLLQLALIDIKQIEHFEIVDMIRDDFVVEVFVELNHEIKTILYFKKNQDQWKIINLKSNRELTDGVRIEL